MAARLRGPQSAEQPVLDGGDKPVFLVRAPYRVCPLGAHIDHQVSLLEVHYVQAHDQS